MARPLEKLFTAHRLMAIVVLVVIIAAPMVAFEILFGVPVIVALSITLSAAAVGAYAGVQILRSPDSPGLLAKLVRRLGGF